MKNAVKVTIFPNFESVSRVWKRFLSLQKKVIMSKSNPKAGLDQIKAFLSQKHIAIVGISRNKQKFGNAIFKELNQKGYTLYPVHPELPEYEGVSCYKTIAALPVEATALVICTQPPQTVQLVKEALDKNIRHIWLQQGAQSEEAVKFAFENNINLIQRECILMFAEPLVFIHKLHRSINKLFGAYPK